MIANKKKVGRAHQGMIHAPMIIMNMHKIKSPAVISYIV